MTWRIALTGVVPEGFEDDEYENKLMDLARFLEAFSPGLSYSDRDYTIALAIDVDDPLTAFNGAFSEVAIGSEKVDLEFRLVKAEITEWEQFERELESPPSRMWSESPSSPASWRPPSSAHLRLLALGTFRSRLLNLPPAPYGSSRTYDASLLAGKESLAGRVGWHLFKRRDRGL